VQNLSTRGQRRRGQNNHVQHQRQHLTPGSSASTLDQPSIADCQPPPAGLLQASAVAAAAAMFSAAAVSGHKMASMPVMPPSSLPVGGMSPEQFQQLLHLQQMLMQSAMSSHPTGVTAAPTITSSADASIHNGQVRVVMLIVYLRDKRLEYELQFYFFSRCWSAGSSPEVVLACWWACLESLQIFKGLCCIHTQVTDV
jgi:hypothetical protein